LTWESDDQLDSLVLIKTEKVRGKRLERITIVDLLGIAG
jgi:hypothetical protein